MNSTSTATAEAPRTHRRGWGPGATPRGSLARPGLVLLATVVTHLGLATTTVAEDRYVFPVDAPPGVLTWSETHWDGRLAVDIGIHPNFAIGAPERTQFYEADVVAVTDGVASRLDNPRGGTAVLLHGTDGRTYYYAHLSQATVEPQEEREVSRGTPLGTIGRTGTWTQFLEPHLHLSIASGHQTGTDWEADVDPVWWLERTFGLAPQSRIQVAYPRSTPRGAPFFAGFMITSEFSDTAQKSPRLAGLTLEPAAEGRAPLRAPMTGVVRIHRDTVLGTRIQITNIATRWSLLISGSIEPVVRTGTVAYREDLVGHVQGAVHYMAFLGGVPRRPPGVPGEQN